MQCCKDSSPFRRFNYYYHIARLSIGCKQTERLSATSAAAQITMIELPFRFSTQCNIIVPSSDWREHPDTDFGDEVCYGNGVLHHDLVNVPFYGRLYDTAIIAHPLSASDYTVDPRVNVTHIQFLLSQLVDIQQHARGDLRTTVRELRARQDSIEVLKTLRRKAYEKLTDRYLAKKANEAASIESAARRDSDTDFTAGQPIEQREAVLADETIICKSGRYYGPRAL